MRARGTIRASVQRVRRHRIATVIGTALALVAAGPATAAIGSTAYTDSGVFANVLTVSGTSGDDEITIALSGSSYVITDPNGISNGGTGLCVDTTPNEVTCPAEGRRFLSISTGEGNDRAVVASGAFTVGQYDLGPGDDFFQGGAEDDGGRGAEGNDTINLGPGDDGRNLCAVGNEGNDTINAEDGADGGCIEGDQGDDVINGGAGNDRLAGMQGNDLLNGGPGDDSLDFLGAHDSNGALVYADEGDDVLNGDAGDDVIHGGRGADRVDGGDGADRVGGRIQPSLVAVASPLFAPVGTEDAAIDDLRCGPGGGDSAYPGAGDLVALDCESVLEPVDCPPGATCRGVLSLSPGSPASASSGGPGGTQATAAGQRRKRHRTVILGSHRFSIRGSSLPRVVLVKISQRTANRRLRHRGVLPTTKTLSFQKFKKRNKKRRSSAQRGHPVGKRVVSRTRFRLTR